MFPGQRAVHLSASPATVTSAGNDRWAALGFGDAAMVQCKLCKKWFKTITNTHLNGHEISSAEYMQLYGEIVDPDRRICSVPGCTHRSHAQRLCTKHYQRYKKRGQPILKPRSALGSWGVSTHDLAYLAGFIDGEGTIGLRRIVRPKNRGGYSYEPYIEAGNTDPLIIEYMHEVFGGDSRQRHVTLSGNCKPILYVWCTKCRSAIDVCRSLLPYLRMKRGRAEILVNAFLERPGMGGRRPYEPSYWEYLEELYQQLKTLNHRGK